jgi:hypothetical protein
MKVDYRLATDKDFVFNQLSAAKSIFRNKVRHTGEPIGYYKVYMNCPKFLKYKS